MAPTRFIPVSEWPKHHIWPTIQSLRFRISKAESGEGDANFLKCIHRVGHRVLIDESAFIEWVRNQHSGPDSKRADNLGHDHAAGRSARP